MERHICRQLSGSKALYCSTSYREPSSWKWVMSHSWVLEFLEVMSDAMKPTQVTGDTDQAKNVL